MNTTSYISCASNRVPNSADWGANNLICYGACNSVAIYDPSYSKIGKVTQTLHRHKDRINVVRWLRKNNGAPETELLSASTDGTAVVWTEAGKSYDPASLVDGNPLTIADGIYLRGCDKINENQELLICTSSIEGTFTIWYRDSLRSISKLQTLSFGRKIPTEARLSFLPSSQIPLIAIALDDSSIHIYCQISSSRASARFIAVQILYNHEDWIRSMDFTHDASGDCYLATGSQDTSIRLWKIYLDRECDETDRNGESQRRIKRFGLGNVKYAITLESILCGHEHWVYGVTWHPPVFDEIGKRSAPPALLSCAMDKSMIVWEADSKDGVWREVVRVGEVGGNSLGFYGCKYAPDGLAIIAHSYQGSFHLWRYNADQETWTPGSGPTGHFSGVVDLCWEPKGRFLLSASADQTTRVHAPWRSESGEIWHEIGRPQVHGYDLSCITMLSPYTFASGAEEKVVRVFGAPTTFQKYLSTIATTEDWEGKSTEEASVPALGLTNKAIFDRDGENEDRTSDLDYTRPPTEEELIRHTLWPEMQKLYGHGYEIFSIASRNDGTRFATACKSASADYAAVIIWCTKTWSQIQKIASHRLTVTQMAFSPDDNYFVTVSRDRRFVVHRSNEKYHYEIIATSSKTNAFHARIIWCCAWTHDSKYFATGSRDGRVGLWKIDSEKTEYERPIASLEINDSSVTALAFAPSSYSEDSYLVAIGFDNGRIDVRKIILSENHGEWRIHAQLDTAEAHHLTVKRLAFRPHDCSVKGESAIIQLASCGMDNTLKIHDFRIAELEAL